MSLFRRKDTDGDREAVEDPQVGAVEGSCAGAVEVADARAGASAGEGAGLAPDEVGTVQGWRMWQVAYSRTGNFQLSSLVHHAVWTGREVQTATCSEGCRTVPSEECGCGFYAKKALVALVTEYDPEMSSPPSVSVVGRVNLWGKVLEGQGGYRAEKAYVDALWVIVPQPYDRSDMPVFWRESMTICDGLQDAYGVPCVPAMLRDVVAVAGEQAAEFVFSREARAERRANNGLMHSLQFGYAPVSWKQVSP